MQNSRRATRADPGRVSRLSRHDGRGVDRLPNRRPLRCASRSRAVLQREARLLAGLLSGERRQARRRRASGRSAARSGSREQGFVFACFNNTYKITPDLFAIWMRLLEQAPGSVLWLLRPPDNREGERCRRRSCADMRKRLGVSGERLVFAANVPFAKHVRPAAVRRSGARHLALQCAHDGERCAVGERSDPDVPRKIVPGARGGQPVAGDGLAGADRCVARRLRGNRSQARDRYGRSGRDAVESAAQPDDIGPVRYWTLHARSRKRPTRRCGSFGARARPRGPSTWRQAPRRGGDPRAENRAGERRGAAAHPGRRAGAGRRRAGRRADRRLDARHILHAGPPIEWARMCGPMRGAVCGASCSRAGRPTSTAAESWPRRRRSSFAPNHHFGAVGPMTGITTRSMPLLVVENRTFGNRAYCAINEGLGKVMRFGGNDAEVLARLAWLRDEFGPVLGAALRAARRHALQAAHRARPRRWATRCTSAMSPARPAACAMLAPALARTRATPSAGRCLEFIGRQRPVLPQHRDGDGQEHDRSGARHRRLDHRHRDVRATAPTSASASPGRARPGSPRRSRCRRASISRASAPRTPIRTWATRRSSRRSAWARSPWRRRRRWPASSAPAASRRRRLHARDGRDHRGAATRSGRSRRSNSPACRPASTCAAWSRRGIAPAINTGIAHRRPGVGQVGAGVARAPLACFEKALARLPDQGVA